jgi:hypothetical protein
VHLAVFVDLKWTSGLCWIPECTLRMKVVGVNDVRGRGISDGEHDFITSGSGL